VGLLRELIESSSRGGDTVLDPFGGSGSTGVAALLSGRKAVLVEVNPIYAELAAQRVAKVEAFLDQMVDL
jgi:site-specific DNA-methyltransferase (adenine-specific)